MNASRWFLLLGLAAWVVIASSVAAQQSAPRIGYLYPAGSRQGAELDLVVGGRNLQGIATASVSGSGVQTFAFGCARSMTAVPAIAETVTARVTIAADAEPGQRELRLETPAGLTNPLVFTVGQLPEFREKFSASARELIPYLPDAVPGWFQAAGGGHATGVRLPSSGSRQRVEGVRVRSTSKEKPAPTSRPTPLGMLPAIPFEIVEPAR